MVVVVVYVGRLGGKLYDRGAVERLVADRLLE